MKQDEIDDTIYRAICEIEFALENWQRKLDNGLPDYHFRHPKQKEYKVICCDRILNLKVLLEDLRELGLQLEQN